MLHERAGLGTAVDPSAGNRQHGKRLNDTKGSSVMRTIRLSSLAAMILIAISLLVPASALAGGDAETEISDHEVATARFALDSGDCVTTFVNLMAAERSSMSNGDTPDQLNTPLRVVAFSYDECLGEYVMFGDERLTATGLEISEGLNGATLAQSLELYDWVGDQTLTIVLDLAWEATGPPQILNDTFVYDDGGTGSDIYIRSVEAYKDKERPAFASGTIAIGPASFAAADPEANIYGIHRSEVSIDFED